MKSKRRGLFLAIVLVLLLFVIELVKLNQGDDSSSSISTATTINSEIPIEEPNTSSVMKAENQETSESMNPTETQSTNAAAKTQPEAEVTKSTYTFRTEELYQSHYQKHGAEFGSITKEEYLALANDLIISPTALHKPEAEDGDDLIYDPEKNQFLVFSTDGYIRTFFCPDDGMAYYERQ